MIITKNYALLQTLSPALHCPLCAGELELLVKGSLAVMEQEPGGRRAYGRLAGSVCQLDSRAREISHPVRLGISENPGATSARKQTGPMC